VDAVAAAGGPVLSAPAEFDRYTLVLLRRPADAPALPEEEIDALQERHLAHLSAMRERGALLVAGPFSNQPDDALRGMCLYRVGLEEARRLAEEDPAVKAGRLAVDVLTWSTAKGALAFPG
jgi:uncharacterized protein YciI